MILMRFSNQLIDINFIPCYFESNKKRTYILRSSMMNKKYSPLSKPLLLPNGIELSNRFFLSPMITNSSTVDGYVTAEDELYHARSAASAPIQVTGAADIEPYGQLIQYGFSVADDRTVPGLK